MAVSMMGGCEFFTGEKKVEPPPLEYELTSPYKGVRTLAVAPAVNQSGSRDFDVLKVSDSLFEELQQVEGLNVLPAEQDPGGDAAIGDSGRLIRLSPRSESRSFWGRTVCLFPQSRPMIPTIRRRWEWSCKCIRRDG